MNSVISTAAESAAMQKTVSLDCGYNNRSAVFCVTFTSAVGCPSMEGSATLIPAGKMNNEHNSMCLNTACAYSPLNRSG